MSNNSYKALLPQYQIEGFDPNELLTKIQDVNDSGEVVESLFMRFKEANAWFFTIYPNGAMNHQFVVLNDKKAVVTASVFRDIGDPKPAATATATRYYGEDINGRFYEQNAVTAAYRKALGYLGFDTPLDAHDFEGIPVLSGTNVPERGEPGVIIEAQVPRPIIPQMENSEPAACPKVEKEEKKKNEKRSVKEKNIEVQKDVIPESAEETAAATSRAKADSDQNAPVSSKDDVPQKEMTLSEAENTVFPIGSYKGKTIKEALAEKGSDFIRWHCDTQSAKNPNAPFTKALQVCCSFYGC